MKAKAHKSVPNGFFISFEGIEGSGKSTQASLLAGALTLAGYRVLATREPGGTPLGEELRRLVKHAGAGITISAETELLLMCASRTQLMREQILPFLEQGGIVICDRFADSTTVYQGYGRGLDLGMIQSLHAIGTCGRWPDLTVFMDLPLAVGLGRAATRGANATKDRFEAEAEAFHARVHQGFNALADQQPQRIRRVDATLAPDAIHPIIRELVTHALG